MKTELHVSAEPSQLRIPIPEFPVSHWQPSSLSPVRLKHFSKRSLRDCDSSCYFLSSLPFLLFKTAGNNQDVGCCKGASDGWTPAADRRLKRTQCLF